MSWSWRPRRPGGGNRDVPWIPPEMGDRDGLIGIGGDLSPPTLLRAYSDGVFPWFSDGDPILWWSPDPRGILELGRPAADTAPAVPCSLHVSRRLARTIRSGRFRVTVDRCFGRVMRACGESRPEGTWVTDTMLTAYAELHRLGHAHSLEVWAGDELAGGIYGVAVGGLFAGESMFHTVTDASKVALVALVERLRARGYVLFDVQMKTEHTGRMGVVEIPRSEYLRRLRDAVGRSSVTFD